MDMKKLIGEILLGFDAVGKLMLVIWVIFSPLIILALSIFLQGKDLAFSMNVLMLVAYYFVIMLILIILVPLIEGHGDFRGNLDD